MTRDAEGCDEPRRQGDHQKLAQRALLTREFAQFVAAGDEAS
jgi:hypothetical protein